MKLVIDRQKWLRGEGSSNSYLLRGKDRKMCCLGFLALQCGYTQDEIIHKESPSSVGGLVTKFPSGLVCLKRGITSNSIQCHRLMTCNDDELLSDEEREGQLIDLFHEIGIDIEFIN